MSEKQGIHLIIDCIEALRVRIGATREKHATPPTNASDTLLIGLLDHWTRLCRDALKAAVELKPMFERVTACLALPADASPSDITIAIEIMLKRLQQLENARVQFSDAHVPLHIERAAQKADDILPGLGNLVREGRLVPDEPVTTPEGPMPTFAQAMRARRQADRRDQDEEPRASYVLERMEGLVLGGWLGDAVKNLERVSEYMRANEERMSEDVFDELSRVADKLGRWADEIGRGNMFPEQR